ncbi:MAG: hypothetical protein WCA63_04835 [Gallionella sp.]
MKPAFPLGDRAYYVSDERLRAFRQLTPEQKLRWVEEMATFLRMAKIEEKNPQEVLKRD